MSDKKFRLILICSLASLLTWVLYKHNSDKTGGFSVSPPENPGKLSIFDLARAQRKEPHQSSEEIFADREAQEAFLKNARISGKARESEPEKTAENTVNETGKNGTGDLWSYAKSWEVETNQDKDKESRWSWKSAGYMSSDNGPENEPTEPVRAEPEPEKVRVVYVSTPGKSKAEPRKTNTSGASLSEADIMLAMADTEVNEIVGRTDSYGSGNLLKLGSEYLGVIMDAIEISTGDKQNLIVDVVGRLSPHTVNQPFKMFAEASLSGNGSRVIIRVKQCIDPASSARGLKCAGDIKGIDGRDGLRGDVYNPSVWASIVRTAGTLLSQYSLSSMTSSVTQGGVIMDQSQSNKILQSLAAGWQALGNELATQISSQGSSVSVAGGSVVRVLVTEDSELW